MWGGFDLIGCFRETLYPPYSPNLWMSLKGQVFKFDKGRSFKGVSSRLILPNC